MCIIFISYHVNCCNEIRQYNFQDERKTDKLVLSIAIQNNLADFLLDIITFVSDQTQNYTKLNRISVKKCPIKKLSI